VTGTNLSNYSINATDGTLSVRPAGTTTALSVSSTSINPGTSVTLSAQVASVTTGMPTGTVAFYDGATLLGTALLVNGSASYSTASLVAGGTHTVSATYSGDTNLMGSTSASSVGIVVSSLDFTFSTSGPVIQTVTRAATTTFSYSIAPTAGTYPGMVSFTVSGLPSGAEYSLSPSTIAANAGKQTLTLTVTVPGILTSFRRESTSLWQRCGETTLSLGILLPLVTLRKKRKLWQDAGKRALLVFAVLAGVVAAIGLSGCGADSSLVKQGPQSYVVTMTATCGAVQHSSTVTLKVQ
jgi:hypothetical protein